MPSFKHSESDLRAHLYSEFKVPLRIKVTPDMKSKIAGYGLSYYYAFTIKFEDGKGFSKQYSTLLGDDLGPSGTITIEGYTHTNTWTSTWVKWGYFFPLPVGFGFVLPELWVDLYTADGGTGSSGGGGGGIHIYFLPY